LRPWSLSRLSAGFVLGVFLRLRANQDVPDANLIEIGRVIAVVLFDVGVAHQLIAFF